MKLVPIEPTEEMLETALSELDERVYPEHTAYDNRLSDAEANQINTEQKGYYRKVYRAMINAVSDEGVK